ncbi:hypothetical protein CEY02_18445, partial [Bacillus pumilus]
MSIYLFLCCCGHGKIDFMINKWREWLFLGKILDAKALTSAMDTRAKHYQALREEMTDLKKA